MGNEAAAAVSYQLGSGPDGKVQRTAFEYGGLFELMFLVLLVSRYYLLAVSCQRRVPVQLTQLALH